MQESNTANQTVLLAVHASDGSSFVDVRNCAADLAVDTLLTEFVDYRWRRSAGDEQTTEGEVRRLPIACRVTRIEAYRHEFAELASGMTARVWLTPFPTNLAALLSESQKCGTSLQLHGPALKHPSVRPASTLP